MFDLLLTNFDDAATTRPESLAGEELRRFVRVRDTDDGMVRIEARLRPDEAALVVHALDVARRRAWRSGGAAADTASGSDRGTDRRASGVSAETSATRATTSETARQPHEPPPALSRADALVAVAEGWLAATAAADSRHASGGPPIELVVHVDHAALLSSPQSPAARTDTSPALLSPHATLAGGTPISLDTARRLACDASVVLAVDDAHPPRPSDAGRERRARGTHAPHARDPHA